MKDRDSIIEQLKTTPIVQVACQKAGISRATYYRWRKENAGFKKKIDSALREGVGFISDLAESQLISLIKDKHPTAIFYWLNHRHPDYSDKRLLLPIIEQKHLIEDISSFEKKKAFVYVLEKMIQGKISSQAFRSFLSSIGKFAGKTEEKETDWAVTNLRKLIDRFSSLNREEGEPPKKQTITN